MEPNVRIAICDDVYEIAKAAGRELLKQSHELLAQKKRCNVALSGGTTPKFLFDFLVNEAASSKESLKLLQNVNWFFSDERFVPRLDKQSNYCLASDSMFSKLDLDEKSIYAIPTHDISPEQSAQDYEKTIKRIVAADNAGVPAFNLIYLGMGDDGHTASLFPGTDLVNRIAADVNLESLVESLWVQKAHMHRITFMPRLINHAEMVIIMASGMQKAKMLENVFSGLHEAKLFPVQFVRPARGELIWLVDQAAAQFLS